jgi:hypothetical protein
MICRAVLQIVAFRTRLAKPFFGPLQASAYPDNLTNIERDKKNRPDQNRCHRPRRGAGVGLWPRRLAAQRMLPVTEGALGIMAGLVWDLGEMPRP